MSKIAVFAFALCLILSSLSLAANDVIRINFQNKETAVPEGYFADYGELFDARDNGLTYGWSKINTDMARKRDFDENVLLDTMNHMRNSEVWELEVADGIYNVTVAIGDAWESTHTLAVEEVLYWENAELENREFYIKTKSVEVTDGRLTLSPLDNAKWGTRLCYIIVEPAK